MIVLGINGFKNEHDPAAALIINGKMVGFAEEERFVRIKHALNYYPHNAVNWLLTSNNIDIDEIDIFIVGQLSRQIFMPFIMNLVNVCSSHEHTIPFIA